MPHSCTLWGILYLHAILCLDTFAALSVEWKTDAIPVEAFNAIVESERYDLDLSLKCQNEAFTSEMDSEFLGNTVWLLQALWPLLSAPLLPPFSFYSSSFIYPTTHLQGILTFILLSSTWLCKEWIWFCYCCVLAIKEITIRFSLEIILLLLNMRLPLSALAAHLGLLHI